jgi:CheY-like chemotaxis protein
MEQKKILVVDDEPVGRQLLQAVLLPEGYDVEMAENGKEAILKMETYHPDLVLLDVMMPGMDGYETMNRARTDPKIKNIPVIFITALDDRDSRIRGLESGAHDYIAKPFDRIEILTKIKNLISKLPVDKSSQSNFDSAIGAVDSQLLKNIASEIYNLSDHQKYFSGKIEISCIGAEWPYFLSGCYYKDEKINVHILFGSTLNEELTPIVPILISTWFYKLLPTISSNPCDLASYLASKIKNSAILSDDQKSVWMLIMVSKSDTDWRLSGFNQTIYQSVGVVSSSADVNQIFPLDADRIIDFTKGTSFYLFSHSIFNKIVPQEIIYNIKQVTATQLLNNFLTTTAGVKTAFTLQVCL